MESISIIHPSRQRPLMAYETAQRWLSTRTSKEIPFEYILSIDITDTTLHLYKELFEVLSKSFDGIKICVNDNKSCIEASNSGANISENNLIILVSDDFDCFEGLDTWLLEKLKDKEDYIVKTSDLYQPTLITLPIMDRTYYNRFGYIYYYEYEHLFCDTEMTEVAHLLDKVIDLQDGVHYFIHKHWTIGVDVGGIPKDEISEKNDATWNQGETLFNERKKNNFDLILNHKPLLNILICTLTKRVDSFNRLINKLNNQIINANYNDVKVLYLSDDGEMTIGKKRNMLLEQSDAKYICFIDDDDDISDNYVELVRNGCLSNKDCVSLNGIISFNQQYSKFFIHSLKYESYYEENSVYYRPPNHLNAIKKDLVKDIKFEEINFGEDTDWAMKVCNLGILKTENEIKEIIYLYLYNEFK